MRVWIRLITLGWLKSHQSQANVYPQCAIRTHPFLTPYVSLTTWTGVTEHVYDYDAIFKITLFSRGFKNHTFETWIRSLWSVIMIKVLALLFLRNKRFWGVNRFRDHKRVFKSTGSRQKIFIAGFIVKILYLGNLLSFHWQIKLKKTYGKPNLNSKISFKIEYFTQTSNTTENRPHLSTSKRKYVQKWIQLKLCHEEV